MTRALEKRVRRTYTDEERRFAVVKAMTDGIESAARQLDISPSTLRQWYSGNRQWRTRAWVEEHKGQLADALEQLTWEMAVEAREKVKDAPLNQLMVGVGIAVDKTRILRGEATSISDNRNTNATIPPLDISRLTPEQRGQLLQLIQAARREPITTQPEPIGESGGGVTELAESRQITGVCQGGVETSSQPVEAS